MKREARLLLSKSVDSLVLGVEFFNRPWDRGRVTTVLIMLDHAFEMLLKAAILHKGGKIRERRAKQTIGFEGSVRKCLTDAQVKCLSEEQALTLQALNSLRDSAQHHLIDLSEQHLYLHAQAAVTLFRDLYRSVFGAELVLQLPERILPISTSPPTDLAALFDQEISAIQKLLQPHQRRHIEARAKLRALAVVDCALKGEQVQPTEASLNDLATEVRRKKPWEQLFPGVAAVNLTSQGTGPRLDLRLTKKEGIPIQLVSEGTPGATVVAVKRVDDLSFYNLGRDQLANHVGLSGPKTTAVIRHLKLEDDPQFFKAFTIGKARFKRFSQEAIKRINEELPELDMAEVWAKHGPRRGSAS